MIATCQHCSKVITWSNGAWVDKNATGDDIVWQENCPDNDSREAWHEPARATVKPEPEPVADANNGTETRSALVHLSYIIDVEPGETVLDALRQYLATTDVDIDSHEWQD